MQAFAREERGTERRGEILELGGDDAHFFAIALHEKMFVRVLANWRDEIFA